MRTAPKNLPLSFTPTGVTVAQDFPGSAPLALAQRSYRRRYFRALAGTQVSSGERERE